MSDGLDKLEAQMGADVSELGASDGLDFILDVPLAVTVELGRSEMTIAKVLALGDSPNDLPLLEVADIAVVVHGSDGPHPELCSGIAAGRFQLAAAPHANGWDEAVRRILKI